MKKICCVLVFIFLNHFCFAMDDYQIEWNDLSPSVQTSVKELAKENHFKCARLSLYDVLNEGKPDSLKCMLLALNTFHDNLFKVTGIVGNYAIYEMNTSMEHLRFALKREKGKLYPQNSKLGLGGAYKVIGTQRFKTAGGGEIELYALEVIERNFIKVTVTYPRDE